MFFGEETFREILTRLLRENAGYYHPEEDGIVDEWIEELSKATDARDYMDVE